MKTKEDILKAIETINNNANLTYGYREDVTSILEWVLEKEDSGIDGLSGN